MRAGEAADHVDQDESAQNEEQINGIVTVEYTESRSLQGGTLREVDAKEGVSDSDGERRESAQGIQPLILVCGSHRRRLSRGEWPADQGPEPALGQAREIRQSGQQMN